MKGQEATVLLLAQSELRLREPVPFSRVCELHPDVREIKDLLETRQSAADQSLPYQATFRDSLLGVFSERAHAAYDQPLAVERGFCDLRLAGRG